MVVLLDDVQGSINLDGNIILLGVFGDVIPTAEFRQVEGVGHGVELHHINKLGVAVCDQLGFALGELVADELQEDQRQHHVLVFRRFDAAAQLVGGGPERLLEAFFFFGGGFILCGGLASHTDDSLNNTGNDATCATQALSGVWRYCAEIGRQAKPLKDSESEKAETEEK